MKKGRSAFSSLIRVLGLCAALFLVAIEAHLYQEESLNSQLIQSITKNDVQKVRFLLSHGADVNSGEPIREPFSAFSILTARIVHSDTMPTLHHRRLLWVALDVAMAKVSNANQAADSDKLCELLVLSGANHIGRHDTSNSTALCIAANLGLVRTVRALIRKGASVNERDRTDKWGLTPLMLTNDADTATTLISSGADVNATDWTGHNALSNSEIRYRQHGDSNYLRIISVLRQHAAK